MNYSVPLQPRQIRLELSSFCNAHCRPCHGHGDHPMTRPKGNMSLELVKKCLEEIRHWPENLKEIVPNAWGESFLHQQWPEILDLIAQKLPFTRLVVPTNGTLLTDGSIKRLASVKTLGLVNFSVNAFLPQTYEAFHKLPGSKLQVIEEAVKRLRELRPDVIIWISMVRSSEFQSPSEVDLFKDYWGKIVGWQNVQINEVEYSNRPDRAPLVPVSLPCKSLFSDLVVLWDGRAVSCCYEADANPDLLVGDANEESLMQIWHGAKFSKLRELHNAGKRMELAICKGCTYA